MSSVLKELEQLNIKGLLEPEGEVGADEKVVGVADEDTRKIYRLAMQLSRKSAETAVAAQFDNNRETKEHHASKALEYHKKAELLMEIFWVTVKDQFDLWQKPSIGIRKGWKVVSIEAPGGDTLRAILGSIFGR